METNLVVHKTTERMQCHLYDCFTDIHSIIDICNPKYLLRYHSSKLAEMSIFNKEFTSVSKTFKLASLTNIKCFHFWVNKSTAQCKFIAYDGQKITVYGIKIEQQVYFIEQKCQCNVKLEANDQLVYLSMPIQKDETTQYLIGYSKADDFYLIKIQTRNRVDKVQILKLNDGDRKTGFFSWFSKTKNQHYVDIQIHPFISDRVENKLQFISIRDNTIMLHNVELNRELSKSAVKMVSQVKNSQAILDVSGGRLVQTIFTPNDQYQVRDAVILAAYNKNGFIILLQINLNLQNTIDIQVTPIFDNIPSKDFSMLKSKQYLYFVLTDQKSKSFQVLKHIVKDKSKVQKQNVYPLKPIYTNKEKIYLSVGLKQLFLISSTNIHKITLTQDIVEDSQVKKSQFRKITLKQFQTKINKCLSIGDLEQLSHQLEQKQAIMSNWLHPQKESELLDHNTLQEITQNIICTHIVHQIMTSEQYPQLMELLKYQSKSDPQKEEALQNAIKECEQYSVKKLIGYIVELKMYALFIEGILQGLNNHGLKQSSIVLIKQLCQEQVKKCLTVFRKQQKHNPTLFKLLINYSIYFMKIDQEVFQYLFDVKQETKLVKDLILNYKLEKQFITYFVSSKIVFSHEQFRELIQYLFINNKDRFNLFVRKLMFEIKSIEESNPNFMLQHAQIIVKGLKDYSEAVMQIFQQTYPGLMFFFFLNSNARREGAEMIQNMAKECPAEDSYIMQLPFASELGNSNWVLDDALRNRKQQINSKSQNQLIEELNNNKISKIQSRQKISKSLNNNNTLLVSGIDRQRKSQGQK